MTKAISKERRLVVFNKYKSKCAYCGIKIEYSKFHIDHIEPRQRGLHPSLRGSNKLYNLNPSCISCNISKSTFSIEKWRKELDLKYDRMLRDSTNFGILHRMKLISRRRSVVFYFEKHEATY
jgi:5-methylcytosine-specific restriction endonuclease McrA